jgi:hypothetical protein
MIRLLDCRTNGRLVFHEFYESNVPAYAILSHTWYTDNRQEVLFRDIQRGAGATKAGYHKIKFCAQQAAKDGLRYIWVDTCCIDQKNAVELAEAINSMFSWYRRAARCYVYLPDVSVPESHARRGDLDSKREAAFRSSRWFTRGWTLQELLAPMSVDFFSKEGHQFGTKATLQPSISTITGIPIEALQGVDLSSFDVEERLSWAHRRTTKIVEDKVYCLLGIVGVSMPVIYGEGADRALTRLRNELSMSNQS